MVRTLVQFRNIIPRLEFEAAVVALCGWDNSFAIVIFGGGAVDVGVSEVRVPSDGEATCVERNVCADVFA